MVCLDLGELERLETGGLDRDTTTSFERHLAECSSCRDRRAEVRANLSLSGEVRDALNRMDPAPAPARDPAPERIGTYRIVGELGRGGMGVAYLAEQDHPRRQVAIKLVRPDGISHTAHERFHREAEALGRLRHPSIAQIFDAGVAPVAANGAAPLPRPFLVMEYVEGAVLDVYARRPAVTLRIRIDLLVQICDAVHHAHLRGVIHRDLKPANIVVETNADGTPRPKILDFGVAHLVESNAPAAPASAGAGSGPIIGTVPYMSPEQVAGGADAIDARSDVYALGVIAFEVLTGRLPIDVHDCPLTEAARRIRSDPPRRLGSIARPLGGDLERVIARALEKSPDRRYESAAALGADLRRWQRREPITARPASPWYQLRMMGRRNPALVASVVIAIAAIVAGLVISMAQARAARRAQDEAAVRLAETLNQGDYLMNGVVAHLGRLTGTGAVRLEIAEAVHDYYARVAPLHPENELAQRGSWESLRLLAALRADHGDDAAALDLMRRSHAQVRAAFDREPGRDDLRFQFAYSLGYLAGRLEDAGEVDASRAAVEDAAAVLGALVRDAPNDPVFLGEWTAALLRLAQSHLTTGDRERAGATLETVRVRAGEAAALHPDDDRFPPRVVSALRSLAAIAVTDGRTADAEALLRDALSASTSLVEAHPATARHRWQRGRVHADLGRLFAARGDDAGALAQFTAALAIGRSFVRTESRPAYALAFARDSAHAARAAGALGRQEQMQTLVTEALSVCATLDTADGVAAARRLEALRP